MSKSPSRMMVGSDAVLLGDDMQVVDMQVVVL
jgi:hypothetical protein